MARIGEGTWQESLGYRVAEDDPWQKRLCLRTTAPTLAGPWAEAVPTIVPGPEDDAAGRRRYGALHAEAHNLSAFRCGNVWIGLVGMLYVEGEGARVPTADGGVDVLPSDGHIDAQLVRCHDFVCWAKR